MKRSDRQRTAGWIVLALGLVAAASRYWILVHSADYALDDTTALGYKRSVDHGVGVMMGPSGAVLTDLSNLLTSPLGQALIIAIGAALCAACFFRAAWVIDAESL